MCLPKVLAYSLFAITGITLAYNTNIDRVKADNLPVVEFNPRGNMPTSITTDNLFTQRELPVTYVDVVINHPTKLVEKVVNNPTKEIAYETKTEYLVKTVLFPLEAPSIEVPNISRIDKFEHSN